MKQQQYGRSDLEPVFGSQHDGPEGSTFQQPPRPDYGGVKIIDGIRQSGKMQLPRVQTPDPVKPLAVLNLFSEAWLGERYDVWDRKKYAQDWWRSLNWELIKNRSNGRLR